MIIRNDISDIWALHPQFWIVVPTNIGWKTNLRNVMGRGVAAQCKEKFPDIDLWYGMICREFKEHTGIMRHQIHKVIMFPTKPLTNPPYMSWDQPSDLLLIEKSARELGSYNLNNPIALPLVGCGNGGLKQDDVLPILEKYLTGDRFTLVMR